MKTVGSRAGGPRKAYIFPAQDGLATTAVDVGDGVQACDEISVLLGTHRDVDPVQQQSCQKIEHAALFHADGDPNRKRRAAWAERYKYTRAGAQGNLHVTKEEGPAVPALERLHGTKGVSPPANCRGAHRLRSRKAAAGTGRGADLGYDLVVLGQVGSAGAATVDAVSAEVDLEHLAHLGGFALCAFPKAVLNPATKGSARGSSSARTRPLQRGVR